MDAEAPHHNQACGRLGEEIAAEYLSEHGYEIIARNWRSRSGELDIIARTGRTVVAVEVKTRTGTRYGHPLEAITVRKTRRLKLLLREWSREHLATGTPLRVDAVGITLLETSSPQIDHLQGIL